MFCMPHLTSVNSPHPSTPLPPVCTFKFQCVCWLVGGRFNFRRAPNRLYFVLEVVCTVHAYGTSSRTDELRDVRSKSALTQASVCVRIDAALGGQIPYF